HVGRGRRLLLTAVAGSDQQAPSPELPGREYVGDLVPHVVGAGQREPRLLGHLPIHARPWLPAGARSGDVRMVGTVRRGRGCDAGLLEDRLETRRDGVVLGFAVEPSRGPPLIRDAGIRA